MADKAQFAVNFQESLGALRDTLKGMWGQPISPLSAIDEATYRANPFYRQDQIDAVNAAKIKPPMASGGGGMFGSLSPSSDVKDSSVRNAILEREGALRAANLPEEEVQGIMAAEQEKRGKAANEFLTNLNNFNIPGLFSQLIGGSLRPEGANVPFSNAIAEQTRQEIINQEIARQQAAAAEAAAAQASYYDIQPTGSWGGGFEVTSGNPNERGGTGTITSGGLGYSVTGGGADM